MQVRVKDLQVSMDLGNNGLELEIKDNKGNHLGDLRIGRAKVEWCKGRVRAGNGIQIRLEDLVQLIEKQAQ
jgi:hypothetical protein